MIAVKSLIASALAIIIFFIGLGVFEFLIRILVRILGDKSLLQEIWSSIAAAIIASYIAMKAIELVFSKYRKVYILAIFSAAHAAFLIFSLYYMIPTASEAGFGIKEFSVQILTPVASILTAFATLNESTFYEKTLEDCGFTDDDFEEVPYEKKLKDRGITDDK